MIIYAERRFLERRNEHEKEKEKDSFLRDKAAACASLWQKGHRGMFTRLVRGIPEEQKDNFNLYLKEYLKIYEE